MKLKYFILPVVLLFVGAGCLPKDQMTLRNDTTRYTISDVSFDVPTGLVVVNRTTKENGKDIPYVNIVPKEESENTAESAGREINPPFIQVIVYENLKGLSAEDWAKNSEYSSWALKTGAATSVSVPNTTGGENQGIMYVTNDMYYPLVSVFANSAKDKMVVISQNYSGGENSPALPLLNTLLESVKVK